MAAVLWVRLWLSWHWCKSDLPLNRDTRAPWASPGRGGSSSRGQPVEEAPGGGLRNREKEWETAVLLHLTSTAEAQTCSQSLPDTPEPPAPLRETLAPEQGVASSHFEAVDGPQDSSTSYASAFTSTPRGQMEKVWSWRHEGFVHSTMGEPHETVVPSEGDQCQKVTECLMSLI